MTALSVRGPLIADVRRLIFRIWSSQSSRVPVTGIWPISLSVVFPAGAIKSVIAALLWLTIKPGRGERK